MLHVIQLHGLRDQIVVRDHGSLGKPRGSAGRQQSGRCSLGFVRLGKRHPVGLPRRQKHFIRSVRIANLLLGIENKNIRNRKAAVRSCDRYLVKKIRI